MADGEPRAGVRLPEPFGPLREVTRVAEGGTERAGFVGLDRNERVSPLPDWFLEKLREALDSALLLEYPATDHVHRELAEDLGLAPEQVLLTPGTDPTLRSLYQVYVQPGDRVVMLDPSYAMYQVYARIFGGRAIGIGFDENLEPDLDGLRESVATGVKLLLIANPNQPTGTVMSNDELASIAGRAGEVGAVVAVDEAYQIFSGTSALPLLEEWPNVVVLRSFSKAGFAGARIGFAAGSPEVVGELFKVRSAADVSGLAAACARLLIAHPEVAEDYGREVHEGAQRLSERARDLGLEPLPTHANFLLIRLPGAYRPADVVQALKDRKWLIKGGFGIPALRDCIRVTLGPPALMDEFADVLGEALEATRMEDDR